MTLKSVFGGKVGNFLMSAIVVIVVMALVYRVFPAKLKALILG